MEIKTTVSEACLYLRRPGAQGAEITRLASVEGLTEGTHRLHLPTEQQTCDVDKVCIVPLGATLFKVANIEFETCEESFQEGIRRHERGSVLFDEIKKCARMRAELRMVLSRMQSIQDQIKCLSSASRMGHCRKHLDTYLETLSQIRTLGDEAYSGIAAEKSTKQHDLMQITTKVRASLKELRDIMENQRLGQFVEPLLNSVVKDTDATLAQYEAVLLGTALRGGQLSFKDHSVRISRAHISLTIELSQAPQGPLKFLIKYPIYEAGWIPSYEAKIDSRDWSTLHVSYYADAHQASLEDWIDTDLTFSTSQISEPCNPPIFETYVVRPKAPKIAVAQSLFGAGAPMALMSMAVPEAESDGDMGFGQFDEASPPAATRLKAAPIEDPGVSMAAFKLSDKVSLASDQANTTQFLLGEFTLPMKSVLYCCPEVETGIYRVCRLENESPYYLVPSKACSVLIDGSLSATTAMKSVAPHEKFTLFVGDAEEAKMEVGPAKTWTKSGMGLVKQNDKGYYERSVTVTNHGDITCTILLVFNVVESQDSLVKITLDPSKIPSTTVIEAADDIALLDSSQFPALSTTQVDLKWIENPITHNCIAVLSLPPRSDERVTFATVMEVPNGRNVQIKPLE